MNESLTELKHLFSPITINSMTLKNRIVMPPMTTLLANDKGEITEEFINFYTARARGGVALITSEAVDIHSYTHNLALGDRGFAAIYDDQFVPGLRRLTDAIHEAGAKVSVQIHHSGGAMIMVDPSKPPVAPSALPYPGGPVSKELTLSQIKELVLAFGEGARRAQEAGFDAVDVHGGHGYLIAQFMSKYFNRRSDGYGGDLSGRMRFPMEVLREVRKQVGRDFPIIFRFSADERVEGGRDADESAVVAPLLVEAGADCLSITTGMNFKLLYTVAPMGLQTGLNIEAASVVKKAVDVPVIVAGKMNDPILAESVLAGNKADMVAIGRGLVADPDLPKKLEAKRFDDVRWCIACNQGCIGGLIAGLPFTCMVNPEAGRETDMALSPVQHPKRILVAGGGPAGMETARVAALRGHKVTLYEKNEFLGGQFYLASLPPRKQEISPYLGYLKHQLDKLGVQVVAGQDLTASIITDIKPDAVVVATGSKPLVPDIHGIDDDHVVLAHDVLTGKADTGEKVLVVGGGQVGCETAEFLYKYGKHVAIAEMKPEIASDVTAVPREALLYHLDRTKIDILTSMAIKIINKDSVIAEGEAGDATLNGFDTIILAMGVVAENSLAEEIKDSGVEIHVVGDARCPGNALDAISDGAKIGRGL